MSAGRDQQREGRTRVARYSRQEAWSRRFKYLLGINADIHDYANERGAHLIPVLGTPANFFRRIRIERVICRVVKMGNADQPSALGQNDWLRQIVSKLPVEIPFALEDSLVSPVG